MDPKMAERLPNNWDEIRSRILEDRIENDCCSPKTYRLVEQLYRVDVTHVATAIIDVLDDNGYGYTVMNTGHVFYILVVASEELIEKLDYLIYCTPQYKEAVTRLVAEKGNTNE